MYVPAHFREEDLWEIHTLVRANPFGMLLTNSEKVPEVTHLPMMLETGESKDSILGHLAFANPHAQKIIDGTEALAVFSGIHAYISPRWYVDTNQVPTWNYQVVHAQGTLNRIEGPRLLIKLLDQLSHEHESGSKKPWKADWNNEKISSLLKAIVGFKLKVECWEAKSKLGQNRAPADQDSLKKHLAQSKNSSKRRLAEEMNKRIKSKQ